MDSKQLFQQLAELERRIAALEQELGEISPKDARLIRRSIEQDAERGGIDVDQIIDLATQFLPMILAMFA